MAQETIPVQLNGKVSTGLSNLEGVYVINLKTEKAAITDKDGYFSIPAAVGDTLMFSAIQFRAIKVNLTKIFFEQDLFSVMMMPIVNQLKEVIVKNHSNINALSLGIIPKGQKSYTEAERKLYTATDLNASSSASVRGMAGGSISADPLLNFLSGRTKMLKKEIEVEKKESYLRKLENMFDMDYFMKKLKIPSEYVKGFEYYAVENEKFIKILNSNNITVTEFLLGELAAKFNEITASENK
ncbi:hypothetical protein H4V97_002534 [Flavobacterium sp. CG_23.5]|uniref:carboxypeptidase-like regulatory domain-containing protein n=1 Tax=unclassified Flavobacterium TaxID=196869 RepID=UPI001A26A404|nr:MULTISPECIES: carboxypeptidase-like regulatory domain-containing protein [unclassified Flavobacterium]MBG6110298.1 hypothetical protein [Flavobacterium sp. CG_9.10]MBP2284216.1 hypothetical protein [Flavobacterium sp. CG_23.5]